MAFLKTILKENLEFKEYQKDLLLKLIEDCKYVESLPRIGPYGHNHECLAQVNNEMEAQLIYYSNLFEKVDVPISQTEKIIAEAKDSLINQPAEYIQYILNNNMPLDKRVVLQHYLALNMICKHEGDLTETLIREVHSVLMRNIKDDDGLDIKEGHYRTEPVAAKHHLFMDPRFVPESMTELVKEFNESLNDYYIDTCLFSGWLMMRFLAIHPFNDGNGRMSRLLFQFALRKRGLPLIVPLVTRDDVHLFKQAIKHYQQHPENEKKFGTLWAYSAGCVAKTWRAFLKGASEE
jgi:Fic family protein